MGIYVVNISTPGHLGIRPAVRVGTRVVPLGQRLVLSPEEVTAHLAQLHQLRDAHLIVIRDADTGDPVDLPPPPEPEEEELEPEVVVEGPKLDLGVISSLEQALDPNRPPSLQEILTLTPRTAAAAEAKRGKR